MLKLGNRNGMAMLQLWKARQGRKAAIAMLAPLIERSRMSLGEIPGEAWHDSYILGFLAMLASLEARKVVGILNSHSLGLIQSETLAELSGEFASNLGEEICMFSMDEDPRFGAGCYQASVFHAALQQHDVPSSSEGNWENSWNRDQTDVEMELRQLWVQLFEARVSSLI